MRPNPDLTILVASGVNLDLLSQREPGIYGSTTLDEIHTLLQEEAKAAHINIYLECFQTNSEPEYLEKLSEKKWDGCILNPGAWTHTSLAIGDRLKGLGLKFVEVHLSNIYARESFRHHSYLSPHAVGVISGFGADSYLLALKALIHKL